METAQLRLSIVFYETQSGHKPLKDWITSLDKSIRDRVTARIARLEYGHFGNSKALKSGLYELKMMNPALRIYYAVIGKEIVLLISGGDKSRQAKDIAEAKNFLLDFRNRYET